MMPDHQVLRPCFPALPGDEYVIGVFRGVSASRPRRPPQEAPELERAGTRRPDARPAAEPHRLGDATRIMRSPRSELSEGIWDEEPPSGERDSPGES